MLISNKVLIFIFDYLYLFNRYLHLLRSKNQICLKQNNEHYLVISSILIADIISSSVNVSITFRSNVRSVFRIVVDRDSKLIRVTWSQIVLHHRRSIVRAIFSKFCTSIFSSRSVKKIRSFVDRFYQSLRLKVGSRLWEISNGVVRSPIK